MKILLSTLLLSISINTFGQNIFSETELDYKKPFAPYELKWTIGLPDQNAIVLRDDGNGQFTLIRYDKYFFDKWSTIIDYGQVGNYPQLYQKGDSAMIVRFWRDKEAAFIDIKYYDIETGNLRKSESRKIVEYPRNASTPRLALSEDRSKFMIYDYLSADARNDIFEVFDAVTLQSLKKFSLSADLTNNKPKTVYLAGNGDAFVVLGNPVTFSVQAYFQPVDKPELSAMESTFTLKRPADTFKDIRITRQGPTTFFVTCPAYIDNELVGLNVSGFNVVLKTILFSETYNLDRPFLDSVYANSIYTTQDQRNKYLEKPENFEEFYLQRCMTDNQANVIAIFERLTEPQWYHHTFNNDETSLKWREGPERYYDAEDLLMITFSPGGKIKWKQLLQKFQESKVDQHNLSVVPLIKGDTLQFVTSESSGGPSFYKYDFSTLTGEMLSKKTFFDKNYEYIKNYTAWLNPGTLMICAYKFESRNRDLFLVEFD